MSSFFYIIFLFFSLFCYFLGFFFYRLPIQKLIESSNLLQSLKNFRNKYGDLVFLLLGPSIGIAIFIFLLINYTIVPNKLFSTTDLTQLLIFYGTLLVIIQAVVIKDNFSSFRIRPIIEIILHFGEPDSHLTNAFMQTPDNMEIIIVPTYYIRF